MFPLPTVLLRGGERPGRKVRPRSDDSDPDCVYSRVMIRLLVRTAVLLLANAVGLIVASLVLSGFDIDVTAFIIAVVIFTVVLALMLPFLASMLVVVDRRHSAVWR